MVWRWAAVSRRIPLSLAARTPTSLSLSSIGDSSDLGSGISSSHSVHISSSRRFLARRRNRPTAFRNSGNICSALSRRFLGTLVLLPSGLPVKSHQTVSVAATASTSARATVARRYCLAAWKRSETSDQGPPIQPRVDVSPPAWAATPPAASPIGATSARGGSADAGPTGPPAFAAPTRTSASRGNMPMAKTRQ